MEYQETKEKGIEVFEVIITENFLKLMSSNQSSVNALKLLLGMSYSNCRESNAKKKISKEARGTTFSIVDYYSLTLKARVEKTYS